MLEAFGGLVPRQLRAYAGDLVSPILSLLERPIRGVQSGLERLAGVSDIYIENQDLREENDRLRQWRDAALRLTGENDRLRAIIKAPGREIAAAGTGRVVGVGGGAFERSVIVNLGKQQGIRRGLPVMDDQGIIGRLVSVGEWSSRALLITDLNSRVPVRLEGSGYLAIAEGQNERLLRLTYLAKEAKPQLGDRVVSSGHGGAFPPDIPVGRVALVEGDLVLVEPVAFLDRLDYLKILDYQIEAPEFSQEKAINLSQETPLDEKTAGQILEQAKAPKREEGENRALATAPVLPSETETGAADLNKAKPREP